MKSAMISFFYKHRKGIFIGTVTMFLAGIFVGLGGNLFSGASSSDAVAVVGGTKISYQRFRTRVNQILDRMRDSETDVDEAVHGRVKQEVLREMIVEEILRQQGKKTGLRVSDFEVSAEIHGTPQFQRNGVFSPIIYYQTIRQQLHMKPEEYEAWRKNAGLAMKFRRLVSSSIKLSPLEIKEYYIKKNGSLKNFAEEKEEIIQEMSQERFIQLINYFLRQAGSQIKIESFLDKREKGF